jgi:CBS domain-containing protein
MLAWPEVRPVDAVAAVDAGGRVVGVLTSTDLVALLGAWSGDDRADG